MRILTKRDRDVASTRPVFLGVAREPEFLTRGFGTRITVPTSPVENRTYGAANLSVHALNIDQGDRRYVEW